MACSIAVRAQAPAADGPSHVKATNTPLRPADYREWPFLGAGLGMTYQPTNGSRTESPSFTNVFVNPSSYRRFMETGKWPDKTILILEIRKSDSEVSINTSGRFQTTLSGMEAHVKDSRFPDGWAFFNLGTAAASADPLAADRVARCVECHTKNAAVERTFVQFYPTLLEVARKNGTLNPGF